MPVEVVAVLIQLKGENKMILILITTPLFALLNIILAVIPSSPEFVFNGLSSVVALLSVAMQFFPVDVWVAVFSSIVFWALVHLVYGLVNFILKLIPFVNMGQ